MFYYENTLHSGQMGQLTKDRICEPFKGIVLISSLVMLRKRYRGILERLGLERREMVFSLEPKPV